MKFLNSRLINNGSLGSPFLALFGKISFITLFYWKYSSTYPQIIIFIVLLSIFDFPAECFSYVFSLLFLVCKNEYEWYFIFVFYDIAEVRNRGKDLSSCEGSSTMETQTAVPFEVVTDHCRKK